MSRNFRTKKQARNLQKENHDTHRSLVFKENEMEYALVMKNQGGYHFQLACLDKKLRLGVLRGRMRNQVWIREGDLVLVGLRSYQDSKCDIMLRYSSSEVKQLWQFREIPDEFNSMLKSLYPSIHGQENSECDIVFVDDHHGRDDLASEQTDAMTSFSRISFSVTDTTHDFNGSESASNYEFITDPFGNDDIKSQEISDYDIADL